MNTQHITLNSLLQYSEKSDNYKADKKKTYLKIDTKNNQISIEGHGAIWEFFHKISLVFYSFFKVNNNYDLGKIITHISQVQCPSISIEQFDKLNSSFTILKGKVQKYDKSRNTKFENLLDKFVTKFQNDNSSVKVHTPQQVNPTPQQPLPQPVPMTTPTTPASPQQQQINFHQQQAANADNFSLPQQNLPFPASHPHPHAYYQFQQPNNAQHNQMAQPLSQNQTYQQQQFHIQQPHHLNPHDQHQEQSTHQYYYPYQQNPPQYQQQTTPQPYPQYQQQTTPQPYPQYQYQQNTPQLTPSQYTQNLQQPPFPYFNPNIQPQINNTPPYISHVQQNPMPIPIQEQPTVVSNTFFIDSNFYETQLIAQKLANKIDNIPLTSQEMSMLDEKENTFQNLIKYLEGKYKDEFEQSSWHGRGSLQRIIWQDQEFIKAIQDPLLIKVILLQRKNNNEPYFGKNQNKLSDLLLFGLATNRLSYLITATPNWTTKPEVTNVTWGLLKQMCCPISKKEQPRKIDPNGMQKIISGLNVLQSVFKQIEPTVQLNNDQATIKIIHQQMEQAQPVQIYKKINSILKDAKVAQTLMAKNQHLEQMSYECLEVMTEFKNLLDFHQGDYTSVLGYGLISHALDSRHLIAFFNTKQHIKFQKDELLQSGIDNLNKLLNDFLSGKLPQDATILLNIRLKQIMDLIIENRNQLNLTLDSLSF